MSCTFDTESTLSDAQLVWITVFRYTVAGLTLAMSVAVMCNVWWFLVKQKKYRVLPLLVFYVLTVPLLATRFYYTIWY